MLVIIENSRKYGRRFIKETFKYKLARLYCPTFEVQAPKSE